MPDKQTFEPTWALIQRPANYPSEPTSGKVQLIWETNSKSLYRRLSPYADYHQSLIGGFTSEPFFYTYPDEGGTGLSGLKKYESRVFPIGSAPIDVIRVSKFLGSGNGIIFLGKQFLLQTGNAYNETRIYNPLSPIVAAGMALSLGSIRPQRNFDTSAGLLGIASTLIGSAIPNALFGAPQISKPSGTANDALTGGPLETTGGKGLLRAGTANTARAHLESAWPPQSKGSSLNKSFGAIAAGVFKSLFANFIPASQTGISQRSDEGAYGLMIGGGLSKFSYVGASTNVIDFGQLWYAGGKTIRKEGQVPNSYKSLIKYSSNGTKITYNIYSSEGFEFQFSEIGSSVGYTPTESGNSSKPGKRYGDNVGTAAMPSGNEYTNSDVMLQFKQYADPAQEFPTKQTLKKDVDSRNLQLQRVLQQLNGVSGGLYNINVPNDSRIISSGMSTKSGYDRLFASNDRNTKNPINYPDGMMKDYKAADVFMVDNTLTSNVQKSRKLPTAGHFDAINTLEVLGKDRKINNSKLRNWTKWEPYQDDLIAFYFYDVVNDKYIPFRAAITGLTETGNASWEEMPFIGRGDKVYSYGGFNRNLGLGIKIVIGSIAELGPTWQRINYMTTLIKPANYTKSDYNGAMNNFMVPPMVMMTLGDLYKDQPVLIQSITMTVPDDAAWETQSEMDGSTDWAYLASYLKAPQMLYGQLPREIDIALGLIMLEKERAIVGGANFGHAPRTDDLKYWNTNTTPDGTRPNKFHSSLVVTPDGLEPTDSTFISTDSEPSIP